MNCELPEAAGRLDKLLGLARAFRLAIERSRCQVKCASLKGFPHGACGDATDMLGRYLNEHHGQRFEYVSGWKGDQSHAWLECGNVIVDITADQFLDVSEPVLVTSDRQFHDQFKVRHRRQPGFGGALDYVRSELEQSYQTVLDSLRDATSDRSGEQ